MSWLEGNELGIIATALPFGLYAIAWIAERVERFIANRAKR